MDIVFITDVPLLSTRYSLEQRSQDGTTAADNNFPFTQPLPQKILSGFSEHLYNADQQQELQQTGDECNFLNFIWACALMVLCYLGYLGNVLSFLALNRDRRNSATMLLQALSISDIVLLISVNITDAVPYYCDYIGSCVNPWKSWPPIRYVWILTPIGHMCSIWLVVLVAANRYWAVCKPHSASQTWSNKRTFSYIVVVFSIAFIFNVPRFFEYKIVEVKEEKLLNASINPSYLKPLVTYSHDNTTPPYNKGDNFAVVNVTIPSSSDTNLYKNDQGKYNILNNGIFIPHSYNNESSKSNRTYKRQATYGHKEQTTSFGESTLYKVGYKVFLVNTFLVIIPIPMLFVTSLWIIRSLKKSVERSRSYLAPPNKSQSFSSKSGVPLDENNKNQDVKTYEDKQINNNADSVKSLSAKNKKPLTRSIRVKEEKGVSKNRFGSSMKKVSASKEITFLLVTVILVAVACQTPLALFHFVRYAYSYGCRDLVYYLESASKFLVNLNSCINFVLYCVLSPKFRGLLKSLIKCQSPENQKQSRPLLNQERSFKLEKKSNRTSISAKRDEDEKIIKLSDKESDKEDNDDETKALVAVVVAETPILTKIETIATDEPATETEMVALLDNENVETTIEKRVEIND
ncbi:hypothetical protein HELRODRAFT_170127 [Helobdella robusta]|uniref:G-protein coupled receptors family 1 profile domain-containing protein n=1 Tax=Helobdella robusta TaxID=6412 RepID=T1F2P2_HELRO|nr:hypothetical protein HELRODRAFT_170127 [Helobdella robusta]ESO07580.1 hypothetical protein HELRODRAFT_170127 [Helobdella robusta]